MTVGKRTELAVVLALVRAVEAVDCLRSQGLLNDGTTEALCQAQDLDGVGRC